MTHSARNLAIFGLVAASLAACHGQSQPISAGVDTFFYGYINSGEKFGVKIGDTRVESRNTLQARGFRYDGSVRCGYGLRALVGCAPSEIYDSYHVDQLLRNGDIDLKYNGNKVSAVVWSFNLLPYIDF